MGLRREKPKSKKKTLFEEEEEDVSAPMTPLVFEASSDDEEANEDLSLKIVEQALLKRKMPQNDVVLDDGIVGASSSQKNEIVVAADRYDGVLDGTRGTAGGSDGEVRKSERKKKGKSSKKKKVKKVEESEDQSVVIAEEQDALETIKEPEKDEPAEMGTVQLGDNIVLRKLLRGPRYFDPPDSGWGTCYNCGEEGHAAVNCTEAKRKKPCYVCGSLEHNVKQCTVGRDCFICKKGGHRAKDCPEKNQIGSRSSKICLKCGDSGHELFSCKNDYSQHDLKEIQCYVCKQFGHLCCVSTTESTSRVISCYQCGQLGHTGLACSRLRAEASDAATPSSCFKCGEEGHFARECTSSVKVGKRRRELSNTKTPRFHKEKENDFIGHRSAPQDMRKANKKKTPLTDERGTTTRQKSKHRDGWMTEHPADYSPKKLNHRGGWMTEHPADYSPKKLKHRGGWMTEHPADYSPKKLKQRVGWMTEHPADYSPKKSKHRGGWMTEHPAEHSPSKSNNWTSLATPSRSTKIHSYGSENHTPRSKSSKMKRVHDGTPDSRRSSEGYHHPKFSATRFGNSGSEGLGRSNSWW